MKKTALAFLFTFLLAGTYSQSVGLSPLQLMSAVKNEKTSTPELEEQFFDEVVKQISQNKAGKDYFPWYDQTKICDPMVETIKRNKALLEKFLQTFLTLTFRSDIELWKNKTVSEEILDKLLKDQIIGKQIGEQVCENLANINPTFAKKVLVEFPNIIEKIASTTDSKRLKKMPYSVIKTVFNNASGKTKIKLAAILKTIKIRGGLFKHFIKQKAGYFALKNFPDSFPKQAKATTQSEHHLKSYNKEIKEKFSDLIKNNKAAQKMFKRLHEKEQEELEKGRYTFVHAQPWKYHFLQDLFSQLWQIQYKEKVEDYHFLRFEPKDFFNIKKEIKKRKKAIDGTDNFGFWENRDRDEEEAAGRLFLNHAIFGNANYDGECSVWYWLKNYCHGNLGIDSKYLFSQLGLGSYHKKYAKKIKNLEELHKKVSAYGNMLLISLSPEQLKKSVVIVHPCGKNRKVTIDGKKTGDIKLILDTLRTNPKKIKENTNFLQYCLILTHDLALAPHNGPRIYTFNTPDQKILAQYEQLRNEIFEELAQDVASESKLKKLARNTKNKVWQKINKKIKKAKNFIKKNWEPILEFGLVGAFFLSGAFDLFLKIQNHRHQKA